MEDSPASFENVTCTPSEISTLILSTLPPITFTDRDFKGINPVNQDDPMVVSIIIANFMVFRVLIDQGSSTNILYWKTFLRLKRVETRCYVNLMTTFDQGKLSRSFTIRYLLVDTNISYFAIIAWRHSLHASLENEIPYREIVTIKANQKQARQCYAKSLKVAPYLPIQEPVMPHPTVIEGTQVMTMDEGSQIQALTVYQASLGSEFDIDPGDDTFNKGPKPIKELSPEWPVHNSIRSHFFLTAHNL
ncbi:hypothetical protein GmHk_12G034816 [Glycine max]|nr:hypothetical protein GmHk_12G034816 [Glycine max]